MGDLFFLFSCKYFYFFKSKFSPVDIFEKTFFAKQTHLIYANRINNGVTEKLNNEFNRLSPNYFKENEGKEWYDLKEYNQFMADGYMSLVVDELNKDNASPILDFYVDPNEIVFTGCLKVDRSVTISFYIKEV